MFDFPTVMALEPLSALWPSIIVALVLSAYRKSIDIIFASTAAYYAHLQINKAEPEWLPTILKEYQPKLPDKPITPKTNSSDSTTLIQRNIQKVAPKETTDIEQEFDIICKNKELSELYDFFSSKDIILIKTQRRALKSYHKAVHDFEVKKQKFLESIFKVTAVSSIAIYGFYVVNIKHDLFINHRGQWPKYPDIEPYRQLTDKWLLWYYILSIGYHLQRTFLQWHNPGRKDFVALVIHHWSTIICLLFSYLASFLRTGSLVLFIHENSDIFLESAKLSGYMNWSLGKELFFALFVLSWIIMRLWAFSYKVLYEIIRFGSKQLWIANSPLFYNWTCVILLFVLEGLHWYWSTMIFSMMVKKWNGEFERDIRSETESETDSPEKEHNEKQLRHDD